MEWLQDMLYFLMLPGLVLVMAAFTMKGSTPRRYKIVKETNSIGETHWEVWFEYAAMPFNSDTWRMEERFDTEQLATDFIARRSVLRETVKEGTL
jgi:hypothetical protein